MEKKSQKRPSLIFRRIKVREETGTFRLSKLSNFTIKVLLVLLGTSSLNYLKRLRELQAWIQNQVFKAIQKASSCHIISLQKMTDQHSLFKFKQKDFQYMCAL